MLRIAWACQHCGYRHVWRWPEYERDNDGEAIGMVCQSCGRESPGAWRDGTVIVKAKERDDERRTDEC